MNPVRGLEGPFIGTLPRSPIYQLLAPGLSRPQALLPLQWQAWSAKPVRQQRFGDPGLSNLPEKPWESPRCAAANAGSLPRRSAHCPARGSPVAARRISFSRLTGSKWHALSLERASRNRYTEQPARGAGRYEPAAVVAGPFPRALLRLTCYSAQRRGHRAPGPPCPSLTPPAAAAARPSQADVQHPAAVAPYPALDAGTVIAQLSNHKEEGQAWHSMAPPLESLLRSLSLSAAREHEHQPAGAAAAGLGKRTRTLCGGMVLVAPAFAWPGLWSMLDVRAPLRARQLVGKESCRISGAGRRRQRRRVTPRPC